MVCNTTASLDKLIGTDYVAFEKNEDRFGLISGSKIGSNCSGVKAKIFKRHNDRDFGLVQNLKLGETDFNQFRQLVIAVETLGGENFLTQC